MAIKAADQISIIDVTDAYSVILTSEAFTFVGGTGGVAAGATCTTQAVAFCGTNQCSKVEVTASAITCPTGISAAVSGSGTSTVTVTFTTTATISSACEATIPVLVDGITINKKFSFAVAKTGSTGASGKGIKTTVVEYQSSTSGTSAPTGTWATTIPSVSASQYLWTRTTITYTDSSTAVSYSIGMMGATGAKGATGSTGATGATGNGVSSTTVTYQASTSNTTVPTGTWQSTIPSVAAGSYLWTKTVLNYTNGTASSPSYSVAKQGATGATGAAGADAITMSITSSNGTVFKNNSGSTVLTAHVYKAGVEQTITPSTGVCGSLGTVKWYKVGSTTAVASASTLTVSAANVDNVAAYTCQLEG